MLALPFWLVPIPSSLSGTKTRLLLKTFNYHILLCRGIFYFISIGFLAVHYTNFLISSRFDLIFLMLDPQDELYDKRLARHLVSLYYSAAEENEKEFMVCL